MRTRQRSREKQDRTRKRMLEAGLVSERFPEVSSIVFHMTYYQRAMDQILMKRTLSFFPTNYACFHLDCVRDECTRGGFDLSPVVDSLVKNHKRTTKGNIACRGKSEALRFGHASISYEVNVEYMPRGR